MRSAMNESLVTTIGFLAAFGTTASWLPQVVRTWKTRSAEDFSWAYLALFAAGVALWLVYGMLRHDPAVTAANAITLVLVLSVAAIKARS